MPMTMNLWQVEQDRLSPVEPSKIDLDQDQVWSSLVRETGGQATASG